MSKFKSIRELDSFDTGTPFNTADWLAVADASGTTTRKISAADLVNAVGASNTFNGGTVTNSLTVDASVPQLTLNDTDETSSVLGNKAILSCNTNAFRIALGNDSVSRLTLESFNHPSDTSDTAIYSGIQLNSGLAMGGQRTSAMVEKYVSTAGGAVFWLDEGVSWNFRGHEAKDYHRMFIKNEGSAGTLGTDGAGGCALQLEQNVDGFNAQAQIKRNVGKIGSTNYGVTSDYPRGNVSDHQGNIQVQANDGRFSINYICHVDNPNLWYNTASSSGQTTTDGSTFGNIAGLFLYGQGLVDSNQNRCLAPQGGNMDLGSTDASEEWRDCYIQNAVTVSSDRNLKQDIEALSDAEKRVATALKGMVKKYRFKSAFAEKGEDARIHIGFIAQEVEEAFKAEGLDAFRYAILVKNTNYKIFVNGTDTGITQNGNNHVKDELLKESIKDSDEVTYEAFEKYSLRYEELIAFIISAL